MTRDLEALMLLGIVLSVVGAIILGAAGTYAKTADAGSLLQHVVVFVVGLVGVGLFIAGMNMLQP